MKNICSFLFGSAGLASIAAVPAVCGAVAILSCTELTPPPNCYECAVGYDYPDVDRFRWTKTPTWGVFDPSSGITTINDIIYHCPQTGAWTGNVTIKVFLDQQVGPNTWSQLGFDTDLVRCAQGA